MNTIYFLLAVAATSAAIFAVTTRADRISRRRASSDGGSYDPGLSSSSDGWTAANSWFGAHSGQLTDTSSSWDSGGGGDSGGGDAGGGGGSGSND